MHNTISLKKRINWIDWMKVIGIYLIILGHHSPRFSSVIYTFNVPLFFVISGFLSRKEKDFKTSLQKNYNTLIIPYLLINLICWLFPYVWVHRHVNINNLVSEIFIYPWIGILFGIQNWEYNICGPSWFIYSLFIIKILFQLISITKKSIIIIITSSITIACISNYYDIHPPLAILNAMLAIPFFLFGNILSDKYKLQFTYYTNKLLKLSKFKITFMIIMLSCIVISIAHFNSTAWMYLNSYGKNIILFFIGGLSGSILVYLVSLLLNNIKSKWVTLISTGTILILGFHIFLVIFLKKISTLHLFYIDALTSLLILILFIPLIHLCLNYYPIIIGKRNSGN